MCFPHRIVKLIFRLAFARKLIVNNFIRDTYFTYVKNQGGNMAKPVRSDHVDAYGPWAWVAGMALAAFITWLMFYIADGFS